jgi:hypothetical protein
MTSENVYAVYVGWSDVRGVRKVNRDKVREFRG